MVTDRANEKVTNGGDNTYKHMKVDGEGESTSVGAGALGSSTIIEKVEEMPYETGNSFKPVGSDSKTDAQGMKLEGESGAGAQFQDQQVDDSGNAE